LRPDFLRRELEKIISNDCRTLLDVGCGENSVAGRFKSIRKIGLDIFPEAMEKSKKRNIHDEYICGNALEIDKLFEPKSIDCAMALDLLEHLKKKKAIELVRKMENIAKVAVIVQTPNGFFPQGEYSGNAHQQHKCGFSAGELRKMGFKVLGMEGPKFLRKESFEAREPNIFFSILANLLDPFFRNFPEKSFNLLAYKYLDG
jgi:predicted TPR repeat methyltransferase